NRMPLTGRRLFLLIAALLLGSLIINWLILRRIEGEEGRDNGEEDKWTEKVRRLVSSCRLPDELAESAMGRMKSEECKERLREVACAIEERRLHETFPISTCPVYDSGRKDEYIGCYSDSKGRRLLDGHSFTWKGDNSRKKCGLLCERAGYVYYGVQFGVECFCGNWIEGGRKIDEERCHTHSCPNGKEKCGGFESIQVYATGMTKPLIWSRPEYVEVDHDKEYDIRILFLLQLNGRNVRQVRQMFRSVYSPKHHYYIHVDSRQKYILNEAHRLSSILPNVRVASILRSTIWGGASLLPMVTDAIQSSLDLEWDYLINMSESDEMILSMKELEAQLESRRGHSFLATHGHSTGRFLEKQGFDYVFLECENRMWRIAHRPSFPSNIGLNGGSDWVVLHRSLALYSISQEELPIKLRRLFASVILPVESFFHSLAVNSRFCNSVVGGNLRITNWNRKQGCRCAWLKKVVDWCGCSPLSFTSETTTKFELETAQKRGVYFARKFDSVVSNDAILKAHLQSSRFSSLGWDLSHPRANSSFVNIFNAEVDKSNSVHSSFLRSLLPSSEDGRVKDLFMYKESDETEERLVVVYGEKGNDHKERLFHFINHIDIDEEEANVGAFFLSSLDIGTDIDHKEEILRGFSKFIPEDGEVTLLLEWIEIGESNTNKTSPLCKIEWRDGGDKMVATQTLSPYDSIRGRQFVQFNLQLLKEAQSGQWTATVTDSVSHKLGSISFGVFSSDDTISRSTVERLYRLVDECKGEEECRGKMWTSICPDPKSDINGFDSQNMSLY
ncbi:hypothetical protein PENTCL1PPCAC_2364, partial [Pristionchus entomophagus]